MDVRGKRQFRAVLRVILSFVSCVPMAHGASGPSRPRAYPGAPDQVRVFLAEAKRAEALHDPLARCLAYPDYPGNAWPKGLVVAYCHYEHDPAVTLAMVRQALDKHALIGLEARFKADLDRHFAKEDFSEIIHRDFDSFDDSQEAGQLSQQWLEQSPHSAYALTARGEYFRHRATTARGYAWASDTPSENLRLMSAFAAQAIPLFQQAIAIEPRLQEAYAGLGDVATLESDHADIARQAYEKGMAIDPGCQVLTAYYLSALSPRWGGSYPQVVALAEKLKAHVSERPLLALNTEWPQVDLADTVSRTSYEQAVNLIRPVVLRTASADVLATAALFSDHVQTSDRWEQLMMLLEAGRFEDIGRRATLLRDRLLVSVAHEPAWAQPSLAALVRKDPNDSYARMLLATSYVEGGEPARAEEDFVKVMEDASMRHDALYDVTVAMLQAGRAAKARGYVDRFNREYPDDGPGWFLRVGVLRAQGVNADDLNAALRKFVETADRSDPKQAMEVQYAQSVLGQPEGSRRD